MDRIELHLKCLRHKYMNIAEVMWEKMLISYLTQLEMNIGSVTLIECQETWKVYSANLIEYLLRSHSVDRAFINTYMIPP